VTDEWGTDLGAEMTRAELQALYGGGRQRGIEASRTTPNILVFTDPSAGSQHGYSFDGWNEDGSVYFYTGEGQNGDQQLTAGNKSLHEHEKDGRALRLFKATEQVRNPGGKVHAYLGEFTVDPELTHFFAKTRDTGGHDRQVIVFRLRPTGDVVRVAEDSAPHRDVVLVPESTTVPLEQQNSQEYATAAREAGRAARREADLVRRYKAYLESKGHGVGRYRIQLGDAAYLFTDIYDQTANVLYEAKGNTSRTYIRMAIGQLCDYRRYVAVASPKLAVLLPERPSDDLLALITSCDMSCVYATSETAFERYSG
jgi:hypothetical protein